MISYCVPKQRSAFVSFANLVYTSYESYDTMKGRGGYAVSRDS